MPEIAERIEVNPEILHGKPHIVGTRIPVDFILGLLGDGLTADEIIEKHYPHIKKEDILACIRYAKMLVEDKEVHAVTA